MKLNELLDFELKTQSVPIDRATLNRYCDWYRNDIQSRFGICCKYNAIIEFMARWYWYHQGRDAKPNRREPPRKGLFLYGESGRGKTTLMRILWEYFAHYPFFLTVEDMAKKFSNGGAVEALADLEMCSGFPAIIDDLGNERSCRYFGDRFPMNDILRMRYNEFQRGNLTLFTSNMESSAEVSRAYGYSVTSRLMEMCDFVRIEGPDYRLHKYVMEAIRKLEVPKEFTEPNFRLSEYEDSMGRKLPMYEITRDGFTLLAMGFTGKKAMQFKVAYICVQRHGVGTETAVCPKPELSQ